MPRSEKSPMNAQSYSPSPSPPKKKHVCSICERAFTTSGHLARHTRVHTGERNHKCPFPGCETRCSRQDNLQQHYRIHLSPGSRRNSARSNAARKRAAAASTSTESTTGTPPEEQGRVHTHHSSPPDSPPPLAQASLPAPSTPSYSRMMDPVSRRVSATSSPDSSYSSDSHHTPPVSSHGLSLPVSTPLNYNYRSGTTIYHEQTPSNSYGPFDNTTSLSGTSQNGPGIGGSNFSYPLSQSSYGGHSQQHSRSTSPPGSLLSRRSISHINNPRYASSYAPPSPTSVSSNTSGPPTPTYPGISYNDTHSYTHNEVIASQPAHNGHIQQAHLFQSPYSQNGVVNHAPRYSPPLTLAPIQDVRVIRRMETPRHSQSHNPAPYLHHPHPVAQYPSYSFGLGHGAWKSEPMRKGIGAAVI